MIRHCAAVAAFLLSATAAQAALFQIDFSVNGSQGVLGSFEAPLSGGVVSNFEVTLSGVTFDTQVGGGAFEYDPSVNDFAAYTAFPSFTNSVAVAGTCPVAGCFLELYPDPSPIPGDYLAIDAGLANIDDGTKYEIIPPAPIPLPAGWALLATALGGIGLARKRAA